MQTQTGNQNHASRTKRDANVQFLVWCQEAWTRCMDRNAAGLYLFTQGKHSSSLDYCNLFFISQILKHKNGQGRFTLIPHPVQSALLDSESGLPRVSPQLTEVTGLRTGPSGVGTPHTASPSLLETGPRSSPVF